jgi:hypothetical protein
MAKEVCEREPASQPATPAEGRIEAAALCVLVSLFVGVGVWTWWRLVQVYLG